MKIDNISDKLFSKMLSIDTNGLLLILFDNFGFEIAKVISEMATNYDIHFCSRYIPLQTQHKLAKDNILPPHLMKCIQDSDSLIFAVADHEDCTLFRANVLDFAVANNLKILHLPGLEEDVFIQHLIKVNLRTLKQKADRLYNVFFKGKNVIIQTIERHSSSEDIVHNLTLDISNRIPHLDIGVARPGDIAQIPAGEVYLAPVEGSANGTIVINGAAPERVFRREDELVLRFLDGLLDLNESKFSHTREAKGFLGELTFYKSMDQANIMLGELGIGLNNEINQLTGKPINDEKQLGTAHIALGCNTPFGGQISCEAHIDLIFYPNDIFVDHRKLNWGWTLPSNE